MRAVVVTPGCPGTTRVEEIDAPSASPGEVSVRVLEVGICGTDREIDQGHVGSAPARSPWLVIGHEVIGVVDRPSVGFSTGELVTATVRRPCTLCGNCRDGSPDACLSGQFTERGIKGLHGFASELFTESPNNLIRIPQALGRLGVLAEPMSICERGLRHSLVVAGRQAGRPNRAVVVGVGSIGLLVVMLLRLVGIETQALSRSSSESEKAELVRATGARYASISDMAPGELKRLVGDVDLVVEAAGDAHAAAACLELVGTNGVVCLLGVDPIAKRVEFDSKVLADFVTGNRALIGSVNAHRTDWLSAVTHLEEMRALWSDTVSRVIGLTVPPERFREALDFPGIKATVRFS